MAKKAATTTTTPAPEAVDIQTTAAANGALSRGIIGLIPATKSQAGMKRILADDNARSLLSRTLAGFVHVDMNFEGGMRAMGEIITNVLKLPEEIQTKVIAAICEAQTIPMIEETGRKGLALALYAKFPEMLVMGPNSKDTKAGMRLSSYMAAYRASLAPTPAPAQIGDGTGTGTGTGDGGTTATSTGGQGAPKTPKDFFLLLYTKGTNKEQQTLCALCGRAGIEYENWLPGEPAEG